MRRSLFILLGVLAVGAAAFAGSYFVSQRLCTSDMTGRTDDLAWLREEFHLSDAEMARIGQLHQGYMPKCVEMCAQIAARKRELEQALEGTTNVTAAVEQKLAEIGVLRARCQTQMLQHFVAVSQAMPTEQGRRYLAEMQRLTLGFHEQTEQSMSGSAGHAHGHP
jgi:small-conductance mechanosensitive channel